MLFEYLFLLMGFVKSIRHFVWYSKLCNLISQECLTTYFIKTCISGHIKHKNLHNRPISFLTNEFFDKKLNVLNEIKLNLN